MTPDQRARVRTATRLLLGAGLGILILGAAEWAFHLPMLTATIGPIVYVFVAHPHSEAAKLRNAVVGQAVAFAVGIATVAVFGLWHARSPVETGHVSLTQAFAAAVGAGVTLLVLELVGSHHAPAASTVLLITTGFARPGKPLLGLVVGIVAVLVASPLLVRVPPPPAGG